MEHNYFQHAKHDEFIGSLLTGAIAGATAIWVMDRLDWFTYDHQDPEARRQTDAVRPEGLDPAHVIANTLAHALDTKLGSHRPHEHPAGLAVHYALGIVPAALYGAFRSRMSMLSAGQGSLFGLGLFVIQDEGLNSLLGVAADPRRYPWQAHARGLIAHLLFGLTVNTALNLMKLENSDRTNRIEQEKENS